MEQKKKQLRLRIATYNLAAGRYNPDLGAIAADIINANADLVGLQEVDRLVPRSGKIWQAERLAVLCGYPHFYFSHAIDLDGGEYGTAILSRYPIRDFRVTPLTSPGVEARSVGGGRIEIAGTAFAFFNTHLSFESARVRTEQLGELAGLLNTCPSYLLTGDFNTEDYRLFSVLRNTRTVNCDGNKQITFPPTLGIDNIVATQDWHWESASVRLGAAGHSDHRLLCATLKKEDISHE